MNEQKDNKKTDISLYKNRYVFDSKIPINKDIYDFVTKKTEKLVTALYMVTDCMETDDAIKGKIRLLGVQLLSEIYNFSTLSPLNKNTHIDLLLSKINEIISLVGISNNIGFISDMNSSILRKEFKSLVYELDLEKDKNSNISFSLNEEMFSVNRPEHKQYFIKDNYKGQNNKSFNTMSDIKIDDNLLRTNNKITDEQKQKKNQSKKERYDTIVSIIKDKNTPNQEEGVSIKDIANQFKDCSEKTIQRDLNSLITQNLIKKTGSKRWSRYRVITN